MCYKRLIMKQPWVSVTVSSKSILSCVSEHCHHAANINSGHQCNNQIWPPSGQHIPKRLVYNCNTSPKWNSTLWTPGHHVEHNCVFLLNMDFKDFPHHDTDSFHRKAWYKNTLFFQNLFLHIQCLLHIVVISAEAIACHHPMVTLWVHNHSRGYPGSQSCIPGRIPGRHQIILPRLWT